MKRKPLVRKVGLSAKPAVKSKSGVTARKKPVKTIQAIRNAEAGGKGLSAIQTKKLCDSEWAKLVKLNANGLCEFCGKPGVDPHHLVSRRHAFLRHNPLNGALLCKGCHLHWHDVETLTGWEIIRTKRPLSYQACMSGKNATYQPRVNDFRATLEKLRAEIAKFLNPE